MESTKRLSRNILTFAGAMLLCAATAFAGSGAKPANAENSGKGTLHVFEPIDVQGKQLKAGEYKLEWSGTGDQVQLNIRNAKETVVTVSAKVVPVEKKQATDGYTATKDPDGKNNLKEVFFHGKGYELQIESAGTSQSGGNNGTN